MVRKPRKTRSKPAEASDKPVGKSRTAKARSTVQEPTGPRQKDPFGFLEGTDSSIAAYALAEGGADRVAIYDIIREKIQASSEAGLQTRTGTEKNVPNLAATVIKQMRNRGWIVESTWKMVKDPNFIEPTEEPDQAAVADAQSEPEAEEAKPVAKVTKRRKPVRRKSASA